MMSFPLMLSPFLMAFVVMVIGTDLPMLAQEPPIAGQVDVTFGTDGFSRPRLWPVNFQEPVKVESMLVLPDGKILLGGIRGTENNQTTLLVRLNVDGSLDTSFANGGFSPIFARKSVRHMHRLADGRFLAAVGDSYGCTVYRLEADGTLDGTFVSANPVFETQNRWVDIAFQSDGACVLLCKMAGTLKLGVYRLKNDGALDTDFGDDGLVKFGASKDDPQRVLLLPDGRIAVGYTMPGGPLLQPAQAVVFGVIKPTGELDNTFRTRGSGVPGVSQTGTNAESLKQAVVDGEGNILALCTYEQSNGELTIGRITPRGLMDVAWGGDGLVQIQLGEGHLPIAVQSRLDGRVLVLAQSASGSYTLVRLNWDGSLDTSFGEEGRLAVSFGVTGVSGGCMALQDGFIHAVGNAPASTSPSWPSSPVVTRLHAGMLLPTPSVTLDTHSGDQSLVMTQPLHLTASASGPPGLIYTWYRNGAQVQRSPSADYRVSTTAGMDEGKYVVEARYADGFDRSQEIEVKIDQRAQIGGQTYYHTYEGGWLTVQFTMLGRLPMEVKWYRNDQLISTKTVEGPPTTLTNRASTSWVISPATKADDGDYHVEVTNADGTVIGSPAKVFVADNPSVTLAGTAAGYVVEVGEHLTLYPTYNTDAPYSLQWYKNGAAIRGATGDMLSIPEATLKDAAIYTVRLRTEKGNVMSEPMPVSVVDIQGRILRAVAGRSYTITLPVKDYGLAYQWVRGDKLLEDGDGVSGTQTATLVFESVRPDQAGEYYCHLSQGSNQTTAGAFTVEITESRPVISAVELPPARVGIDYEAYLPWPSEADMMEVRGLPAGLSFHWTDGSIRGIPSKSGEFKVTISAKNLLGKATPLQTVLEVAPFLEARTGRFYGLLTGGACKGTLDVTVTSTGAYSGKVSLTTLEGVAATLPIRGVFRGTGMPEPGLETGVTSHVGRHEFSHAKLRLPGLTPSLDLRLRDGSLHGTLVVGRLGHADTCTVDAAPCSWSTASPLPQASAGLYNVGWSPRTAYVPEGNGYGRVTVKAAGTLTLVGKLADNTSISVSWPVNDEREAAGYVPLYRGRGCFIPVWDIELPDPESGPPDTMLSGRVTWVKNLGQTPYPLDNFEGSFELSLAGRYQRPNQPDITSPLVMNMPLRENNVWLDLFGLTSATLTLKADQKLDILPDSEGLAGLKSLKFNAATGLFKGQGVLETIEEKYNRRTDVVDEIVVKRPYTVQGIAISSPEGLGYALGYGMMPIVIQESHRVAPVRTFESRRVTILPAE